VNQPRETAAGRCRHHLEKLHSQSARDRGCERSPTREIADARNRQREKSPTREIAAARSRQGWLGSNVHVTGGKGEKARRAVYGQGASSRRTHASVRVRRRGGNARSTTRMKPEPGDAHARWETIARSANRRDATASAGANAVSGGKASKGRRAPRGSSFRDEGKRGEPQDRQQGETDLHGRRGKTAEVVQNHEGGTRDGRQSIPEGCGGNAASGRRTLRLSTMEGRSLETPREEVRPDGRTVWIGT